MQTKNAALVTVLSLLCLGSPSRAVQADTITCSGFFNDPANAVLVGSDLGGALFGDDYEIANNVALYEITIPMAGSVRVLSLGSAAGGSDPYATLFAGTGVGAAFLGSNYVQAFSTGGDFDLSFVLDVGTYTLAIGVFANMSFAENYGDGTLGDGFVFMGGADYLGNSYFRVDVTRPDVPVPEPATMFLMGTGLLGLSAVRRRHRRQ